jgi:hypothetical protein
VLNRTNFGSKHFEQDIEGQMAMLPDARWHLTFTIPTLKIFWLKPDAGLLSINVILGQHC